ncbi:hypothetical protein BDN71DRAFT_1510573 [Pleurotus eryngii]|uniref:Uncharacterized protein n=1 Tax=Pleurotus eryngii TaxID=5323 RepID=A0A9P5ZSV7_PLEER|nr:hypothetical protein BDN71DRAFT_1510573 [Pleurotus eryngii]
MSTSASFAETARFTYEAISALVPTLDAQQARAGSSTPSTTASSPESEEECRALEAEFLVDLDDDSSASPSTSADSLGEQSSGPPTAPASTTAATTPNCQNSPPESSIALSPLALNDDLAPAAPEPVAQYPPALDVECSATTAPDAGQAQSASPRSAVNALVLSALLELIGGDAEHTTGTFNLGYPTGTTSLGSETSSLSPPAVDLTEGLPTPETGAQSPSILAVEPSTTATPDIEHGLSASPSSALVNAQALRALLQASANSAEQAIPTHDHGYAASAQQSAYFSDVPLPPAHGFPLLAQPQSHFGTPQGYPSAPLAPCPQPGVPLLRYYGPQVAQQYQHGYYNPYAPNGLGLVFGGATPQYAVPGFPLQHQSERPVPHLSAKPLSATGRQNEPASLPRNQVAVDASSSKRKRSAPDWKGEGKAKAVEDNVDADATSAVNDKRDDDDDVAPAAKKPRRAGRGSKGAAGQSQTARKNRSYTLLPDGNYKCSHCGDDKIKNKSKHRQMCGMEGPLRCPMCGTELLSRRHDSLARHLKASRCKDTANAVAAASTVAASRAASSGTELSSTYNDGENDSGAEEDVDGCWDDGNDEHDEYRNVAGPSSVTLEDIPKPEKKATEGKAATLK